MPKQKQMRRGATSVEFALTVPLVFLFFFSALEFGRMHMIRHALQNAVYEGARLGLVPNTSNDAIRDATKQLLDAVAISNPTITVRQTETEVAVSVRAAFDEQSWLPPLYFGDRFLTSSITLTRDAG